MDGIALSYADVPLELIKEFDLSRLIYERGGEKELRFFRQTKHAMLPIRHDGQVEIVSWGCRTKKLPNTGYTWLKTLEAGEWVNAEEVTILATAGIRNGIWFPIRSGIRGLLAEVDGDRAVYMLVEPATYYFKIMTRSDRMPVLIGERI